MYYYHVIAGSVLSKLNSCKFRKATQRVLSDEPAGHLPLSLSRLLKGIGQRNRFIWSVKSKTGTLNAIDLS